MDYKAFESRMLNLLDSFWMVKRKDGVWELDPRQFAATPLYDFIFYDEVAEVDPDIFLAHQWDHSYTCSECGITQKEVVAGNFSKLKCPGVSYRNRVRPFFNYHTGRDDGWRVVRTEGNETLQSPPDATTGRLNSYITASEADEYFKRRTRGKL